MYCQKQLGTKGQLRDAGDISVTLEDRKINVRCHNTWQEVSRTKGISIAPPDQFGVSRADATLAITDFIPNDLVALVFDLEFKATIQGG